MMYQLVDEGVKRLSDGAIIPSDQRNEMYAEYLVWLAEGNTPLPYDPPPLDPRAEARAELAATDAGMARIAEDLITALISKGVLAEADLPQSARSKMAKRSELRSKLA